MNRIKVELISNTPLYNSIIGARTCWKSFDKDDYVSESNIGANNKNLLNRLVYQYHHESVIEHTVYTFGLSKFSRFILQELARHRIASYSVESTRYVIKKDIVRYGDIFEKYPDVSFYDKLSIVKEFCVIPPISSYIPEDVHLQFDILHRMYLKVKAGVPNDEIKYILPENWRVNNAMMTINARSLRNLLSLRTSKSAHFEFRYLSILMLKAIPKEHHILFNDIVNNIAQDLHLENTDDFYKLSNEELIEKILGDRYSKTLLNEV